ncbi:G-type lectin S-receptor-like serine/threonine-protein kinase At2g19130 [Olea europaea var. sylvestris]|uniref:G-type lectin S-receptor-like serine/threonine-protein kinase At2g19130 n=1 Tax=Olea europaea var. sylvestris TaxID=158386 RepID=UPI000C1D63F0|nr:G-type lectin S-receptor-like serine/threonine-protein kinase At2g19130 [Olea europaea var. sylvestris]
MTFVILKSRVILEREPHDILSVISYIGEAQKVGTGSELLMALVTLPMNKEPQPMIPKNTCWFILSVLFFLCFSINIHHSQGADSVTANQPLSGSQTIVSSGNIFELGFFTRGTSSSYYIGIWYKNVTPMTIVWVGNRETPISDMNSVEFKILDGNLMLMDESQISIWSTNVNLTTSNSLVATLDTLLPGSSLAYDKRTRTKKVLTSWKNSEDPAPGLFSFELDPNGSQVIIRWNRAEWYWTSGAWNGLFFSLIPEMRLNNMYNHSYVDNVNESYYTYSFYNLSIRSRYVMDVSEQIKLTSWNTKEWDFYWFQPRQQCDVYAYCGAFGSCNQNSLNFCNCLPGFKQGRRLIGI